MYSTDNVYSLRPSYGVVQTPPEVPSVVKVDAANGVGGASVRRMMKEVGSDWVTVELYNDATGVLNDRVSPSLCTCMLLLPLSFFQCPPLLLPLFLPPCV